MAAPSEVPSPRMLLADTRVVRGEETPLIMPKMITTTVAPQSWVEVGGPGAVRGITGIAQALVVSQSCHVHRQIAALHAQLRRP